MKADQLCPTLWDPMDYTVQGILWGQNTGVGSLFLLHGIFPTQGSNPSIPHCRRILYQLSHQGSLKIMETSSKGPMQTLLHSVPPTPQWATADPCFHQRLLDTHRPVWVSFLWSHCSCWPLKKCKYQPQCNTSILIFLYQHLFLC